MIRQINSLAGYQSFCASFQTDPQYADPHFLYAPDTLYEACSRSDCRVYAVTDGDAVTGVFVALILPEDSYAEMLIGFSREKAAYAEFVALMRREYAGYTMDFVFHPRNRAIKAVLNDNHADFCPEQMRMRATAPSAYQRKHRVDLLSDAYEEQYRSMHTEDTYWTAERVLRAGDRFRVFVALIGEEVVGYLDVTCCHAENEPYDFRVKASYENEWIEADLLSLALAYNQPNTMMYLVDADRTSERAMLEAVGFMPVEGQNSVTATIKCL